MRELVYHRLLIPAVERTPDATCLSDGEFESTYSEHLDRVCRLASGIRSLGVARADRFGVLAQSGHRYVELYHAAYLGAGVITPLNPRFSPRELAHVLEASGARVVFAQRQFLPLLEEAWAASAPTSQVVVLDDASGHGSAYEELLAEADAAIPPEPEESDPVVLMFTGGTTGLPKGVVCDHRAELLNAYHFRMTLGFDRSTAYLQHNPMFHAGVMGFVLVVPWLGGRMVLLPAFEPGAVIESIERHAVTATGMVPTMITMLLAHDTFAPERLASLRTLVYGGSPMPDALLNRLREMLPALDLLQYYGMTEASSGVTLLDGDDHRTGGERLRSVGRPVPGVTLTIRDRDGALPPRTPGEVCVRGGNLMTGYWRQPEATETAFRDGWYRSGDVGYVDEFGYLFLVDRAKDMIVTGGENVYSAEVEQAIATHPDVELVAVVGIPHEVWGEQVHAVIVPRDGTAPTAAELIAHTRELIAGYKVPKSVEFRHELPLSATMKPLKREIRAPYWAGRERAIG